METQPSYTKVQQFFMNRKKIAIRLFYAIVFGFFVGILQSLIFLLATFQFLWLFIKLEPLQQIRNISDRLAVLSYQMMRYISLTENTKPFPFREFPESESLFDDPDI